MARVTMCKKYSAEFKAKIAMAAIKNKKRTAELAERFGLHPTMIANGRNLLSKVLWIFSTRATNSEDRRNLHQMSVAAESGS